MHLAFDRLALIVVVVAAAACGQGSSGSQTLDASAAGTGAADAGASATDAQTALDSGVVIDCQAPKALCGTACIDTSSDPAHCGACARACVQGQTCSVGDCVPSPFGREFFVSTEGSDTTGDGSARAPFATLEAARDAVRALKTGSGLPAGGVAVTVRGGVYRVASTFTLTAQDSGADGQQVVYRSHPGEAAAISGGAPLNGWTLMSAANAPAGTWDRLALVAQGKVYFAPAPAGVALGDFSYRGGGYGSAAPPAGGAFAELVDGDVVRQLGRWPNPGTPNRADEFWTAASATSSGTTVTTGYTGTTQPSRWTGAAALTSPNKPWLSLYEQDGWSWSLRQITAVGNGTITSTGTAPRMGVKPGQQWFATNLLEEIDTAGEYWIDRIGGKVFYWPASGDVPGAASLTSVASVLAVNGASYVTFERLVFGEAQKDLVTTASATHHVTFTGCTFRNAAGNGVVLDGSFNRLEDSVIERTGDAGVVLLGTRQTLTRCEVRNWGRHTMAYGAAASVGGANHRIASNAIHHGPWAAVYFSGGGGDGTLVELNDISYSQLYGNDSGAIYLYGNGNGVELRYNFIHHIPQGVAPNANPSVGTIGIYADEGAAGITAHGNLIYKVGAATPGGGNGVGKSWALESKGTNTFRNNLIARCDAVLLELWPAGKAPAAIMANNHGWMNTVPWSSPYPNTMTVGDPHFMDEAAGNLANTAAGDVELDTFSTATASEGIFLSATTGKELIPFSRIGRR